MQRRSLLSGHEGYTTCLFSHTAPMERPGYVFGFLRRRLPQETVDSATRLRLTADSRGAVFDVPHESLDDFVTLCAPCAC